MLRTKKAQSLIELAILLALVATALISMQVYIKRGMQGRLKDLADQISSRQYESADTTSSTSITRKVSGFEREHRGTYSRTSSETTTTSSEETVVDR